MLARVGGHVRAHHIGLLALIVALGGTSYAAIKLPANSVGTKQLKNKAVTPREVAPKTIRLFKGQKGDRGDPGLQGDFGPQGVPGTGSAATSTLMSRASVEIPCPIRTRICRSRGLPPIATRRRA